jgi:hypothetical protein
MQKTRGASRTSAKGSLIMSEVNAFIVYCIELIKEHQKISGAEAYDLLRGDGFTYIRMTYPALHTMSPDLICDDLLSLIP